MEQEGQTPYQSRSLSRTPYQSPNDGVSPQVEEGVAYQVHNVFTNISDNLEKINETLGMVYIGSFGMDKEFVFLGFESILVLFSKFGIDLNMYDEETHEIQVRKIKKVLTKLYHSNIYTNYTGDQIFSWLNFVINQPEEFAVNYVQRFIEDTFHAYDASPDSMTSQDDSLPGHNISCPNGIYERLLLTIGTTCIMYCTEHKIKKKRKTKKKKSKATKKTVKNEQSGGKRRKSLSKFKNCDKPLYRKLIRLFKLEVPDINTLTQQWATTILPNAQHLEPNELKANFIEYMNRNFLLYGINNKLKIEKRAEEFEQMGVFEEKEF
jgi:hypothetical protein